MAQAPGYTNHVPDNITARLREICLALPEAYEERAWVGTRWAVRKRSFAHVLGVDAVNSKPVVMLTFRSAGEELETLQNAGHPFYAFGWARNSLGLVLDIGTDWDEVNELITESYCVLAPKKLSALVDRPDEHH